MYRLRTILVLVLAVWLPLSCCCRLHAMQDVIADTIGIFAGHSDACTHCHSEPSTPDQPRHDCKCDSHDQVLARAASIELAGEAYELPQPMPVPSVLMVFVPSTTGLQRAGASDAARLKASCTLLRLHCALTV